jgi:hypothetical protein
MRGSAPEAFGLIEAALRDASPRGEGLAISAAEWAGAVLNNGERDIAQRELMKDDKRDRFGPGQKAQQRVRVAPERVGGTFAMREAVVQGVLMLPGPVGRHRGAVEVAGLEFVEVRFDQDRYVPAVHGDVDRFLGAQEAGADIEIDVHIGELRAEGARLRSPSFGQGDGRAGSLPVSEAEAVRFG